MITVVTRWETTQLPPLHEWQLWGQMRGAFGITRFVFVPEIPELQNIDIDQYPTMTEALEAQEGKGELVFLEPTGEKTIAEIPDGDIVLVLGCTAKDNLAHSNPDQRYRIETGGLDRHNHLYAPNAAAIALAMRFANGAH